MRKVALRCLIADENGNLDLVWLLEKMKMNIECQRSFDERSHKELSINIRVIEGFESMYPS